VISFTEEDMLKIISIFVMIVITSIGIFSVLTSNTIYAVHERLSVTHGIASGDVTDKSVVIWSRANKQAQMHVEYDTDPNFADPNSYVTSTDNETSDFAAHAKLVDLKSNSTYYYRVWFSNPNDPSEVSAPMEGKFKTAPGHLSSSKSISFIVGGDLGGQGYCRDVDLGYTIFSVMKESSPVDFFVFNGDQIYADEYCTEEEPKNLPEGISKWDNILGDFLGVLDEDIDWTNNTQLRDVFNEHWAYNRADPLLQEFLQNVSMYSMGDDHEVADNYGNWSYFNQATKNRGSFYNLVKAGMDSFFSYSPIDRNQSDPYRIYRSFNWGQDLELFLLDAHSYRSRNDLPNTYANKTLYGKEQLRWLEEGLLNSNATWKVVLNPVPITVPNCSKGSTYVPRGCDNWATSATDNIFSFSKERDEFLNFLVENNIKNVLFLTTDVHYPANIRIQTALPGPDGKKLTLYESVSGPLSAETLKPGKLDPTIDARYMYVGEEEMFNFAYYKIQRESDGKVHFIAQIYNIDGFAYPNSYLDLIPQ
jgi:alkaline phosphatase D